MIGTISILNENRILASSDCILSDISSIIWNVEYYSTGDYKIIIPATEKNIAIFNNSNNWYIARSDDENIGVIERIVMNRSKPNPTIEISGRFAKSILDRRIIGRANKVLKDGHYINRAWYSNEVFGANVNVEYRIKSLVHDCIAGIWGTSVYSTDRHISYLEVERTTHTNYTFGTRKQATGDNLLELSDSMLYEYGLGAKITLDINTKNFIYSIYSGIDRSIDNSDGNEPIIFSPKISNFLNTEKISDITNYKNVAIVGGQGEGTDRFYSLINWFPYPSEMNKYSGINRREEFIDARDLSKTYTSNTGSEEEMTDDEYWNVLIQRGKSSMLEMLPENSYSGEAHPNQSNYRYKVDYNVGDIITAVTEDGDKIKSRIISVTESQDADNGYSAFPKFGI